MSSRAKPAAAPTTAPIAIRQSHVGQFRGNGTPELAIQRDGTVACSESGAHVTNPSGVVVVAE